MKQPAADGARALLRPLASFAREVDPLVHSQACRRDRGFRAGGVGARADDVERPPQPLGLARLEAVGGEHLVHERAAAVAQRRKRTRRVADGTVAGSIPTTENPKRSARR